MTPLTRRQRRHVVETMRRELELYGGLPRLYKRHRQRVAIRLADTYGLTTREILGIWTAWVDDRRERNFQHQRERFLERLRAGSCPGTMNPASLLPGTTGTPSTP